MTDNLDALLDRLADLVAERVAARLANGSGDGHAPTDEPDRMLTAAEAAARLATTRRWVYAHQKQLPVVRLPGRAVRFSERGLARWLARRAGR